MVYACFNNEMTLLDLFDSYEKAEESWKITYSSTNKTLTFKPERYGNVKAVLLDNKLVGYIDSLKVKTEADHL